MSVYLDDGDVRLYHGDAATVLADLPEGSVDCCVTSPPYFGLRDYGYPEQIGLEPTPEEYVAALVGVFRQVWRVLAPWGTCFVNLGDSYEGKQLLMMPSRVAMALQADGWWLRSCIIFHKVNSKPESVTDRPTSAHEDIYLLTKAPRYYWDAEAVREPHSPSTLDRWGGVPGRIENGAHYQRHARSDETMAGGAGESTFGANPAGRNLRNVWSIATEPTPAAHFATFPTELVRCCLAAGCPERVCRDCGEPSRRIVERVDTGQRQKMADGWDTGEGGLGSIHRNGREAGETGVPVMASVTIGWTDCGHDAWRPGIAFDPFIGSGTTALVARRLGLHAVGIDASAEYLGIAATRLLADRARKWIAPGPTIPEVDDQLTLLGGAA